MNQDPVSIVRGVYEAFGRGDVPAILAVTAPDARWEVVGQPGAYPLYRVHEGAEGVVQFFTTIAENEDFTDFTPHEFHGAGEVVLVLGHATYTLKKTGRPVDTDWAHIFRIRDGKVVEFREFSDTAQVVAGFNA